MFLLPMQRASVSTEPSASVMLGVWSSAAGRNRLVVDVHFVAPSR